MKIIENKDCGNSPKNKFVQDLEIAISQSDASFLQASTSEDLEWIILGIDRFKGHSSIPLVLKALKLISAEKLSINHVLSHGKTGASQSERIAGNGLSQNVSNFFQFSSAKGDKVSKITTMVV